MPIEFTCPHCGVLVSVAEQFSGHGAECPRCSRSIAVPSLVAQSTRAQPERHSYRTVVIVVVLLALAVSIVFGGITLALRILTERQLPQVNAEEKQRQRTMCAMNLRHIGLAMHSYHGRYKCFPPAYLADKDGRPMHSWRVLLLPFLAEEGLYAVYSFDEPWDSPRNLALANANMPDVFRCPASPRGDDSQTGYLMVVGPGTISDGAGVTKLSDIADGAAKTIMLVETTGSKVKWLEPRDLTAENLSFQVNDHTGKGIGSRHRSGANILFCDASVGYLENSTDPKRIKAMTTIAGGEGLNQPRDDRPTKGRPPEDTSAQKGPAAAK